jgi:hypothetical protein
VPEGRSRSELARRDLCVGLFALAGLAGLDRAAAQSQPALPDTADAYGAVFDQWVKNREPKTAILVVRRGGKTVFAKGSGADPMKPTLIASLSKAITGACVATLVRDGKLTFTTPLRDALPQFFKQYGAPVDARLYQATVEELLVHRAGLRGNADDDSIYGVFAKRASGGHGWQATPKMVLGEYLLKDRLAAIRAAAIPTATPATKFCPPSSRADRPTYEDYCGEAVFGKLGITVPKLHPDWRMLAGMGGWFVPDRLSGRSRHLRSSNPFLGDTVKAWIDQAQTRWTPTNRDRWYGLGVNTWAGGGRWAVSHGGILHSRGKNPLGEPIEGSIVTHAFRAADGIAVFIALEWSPEAEVSLNALRKVIGETHKVVKTLP